MPPRPPAKLQASSLDQVTAHSPPPSPDWSPRACVPSCEATRHVVHSPVTSPVPSSRAGRGRQVRVDGLRPPPSLARSPKAAASKGSETAEETGDSGEEFGGRRDSKWMNTSQQSRQAWQSRQSHGSMCTHKLPRALQPTQRISWGLSSPRTIMECTTAEAGDSSDSSDDSSIVSWASSYALTFGEVSSGSARLGDGRNSTVAATSAGLAASANTNHSQRCRQYKRLHGRSAARSRGALRPFLPSRRKSS
mmetsp:Transcript_105180/g.263446  ORF Transcript_105180/g.263446 Transcript_105180/m.263446 type:complete len:250 (+) Transcript_105180:66-815(+)